MPTVPHTALLGQFGEAYVASLLSRECLVRATTSLDVGIDLYCEVVSDGVPFLHFWVQVKTGSTIQLNESGDRARFTFEEHHLQYWERQPVPVFAALVATEWPVEEDPPVHVIDVTKNRLQNRDKRTLESEYLWEPGDRAAISAFLAEVVPEASARRHVSKGVVDTIPEVSRGYVSRVPHSLPILAFQSEIRKQIRRTAAYSLIHAHDQGEFKALEPGFVDSMAHVLEGHTGSWHGCVARALVSHYRGQFSEAAEWYEKAIDVLDRDLHFRHLMSDEWVGALQDDIRSFRDHALGERPLSAV